MRRLTLSLVLLSALAAPTPAAGADWRPHVNEAAAYAKDRRGTVAFSVRTPTRSWGWHATDRFASASVLKPMLMLAYLDRRGVRGRALRAADRALLGPMIRRSDNATASRVFGIVGPAGLRRVARSAGMTRFTPAAPVWGLSQVTAADQSRFFLRIESLLPQRHRAYAMSLLASIVESQRWGIGRVPLPGWELYFKGGWGSGTGLIDHQVALLARAPDERVSVAILTRDDGTHAYGKETLRGTAKRLLRDLPAAGDVP